MLRIADLLGRRTPSAARRLRARSAAFAEALEPRMLLSDTPLPSLMDLSNANNVVVRVETNLGDIDFELYSAGSPMGGSAAPSTVANFLNYVRDGDFDLSFFHRLAFFEDDTPFVLQGGGFRFDDDAGLSRVPTDSPVLNEFNPDRSNLERTIAMAKVGGDPDSATSQWFINLGDNATFPGGGGLDIDNGGFTVFGRVLDDRSWDVVQQIVMLNTFAFADVVVDAQGDVVLNPFGNPTPLTGGNPVSFALTDTPVVTDPAPIPPGTLRSPALEERFLVIVDDAEIIKPADINAFFAHRLAYPEGFRSPSTATTVEIGNLDNNNVAHFQVVVRYENGDRDTVIDFGTVAAGGHATVEIADFEQALDVVREFTPYAVEVYSTHMVSAALNHTDMGATIGESFVNVTDPDAYGAEGLRRWDFAGLQQIASDFPVQQRFPFLVWQNLSAETATVTIRIARSGQNDQVLTRQVEGLRRGGLELFNIASYTNGAQSVIVTADQDIVAAMSVYEVRSNGAEGSDQHAHGAVGMVAGAATEGALAGIRIGDGDAYLSIHNTDRTRAIVIDFTFIDETGVFSASSRAVLPNQRSTINLRNLIGGSVTEDDTFTVTYRARIAAPAGPATASVQYVSVVDGETVSTSFQSFAGHQSAFSGGGLNEGQQEILSLFNPYSASDPDAPTISPNLIFRFIDETVQVPLAAIAPGGRLDVDTSTLTSVMSVIARSEAHRHYTIAVSTFTGSFGAGDIRPVGAVASLARYDSTGGASMVTLPSLINFEEMGLVAPFTPLDDPIYDGGIGG